MMKPYKHGLYMPRINPDGLFRLHHFSIISIFFATRTCHGDSENQTAKWKKCLVATTVVSLASKPLKYLDVCNTTRHCTPEQQTNLQGLGFGDGQMCQMHHGCHQQQPKHCQGSSISSDYSFKCKVKTPGLPYIHILHTWKKTTLRISG